MKVGLPVIAIIVIVVAVAGIGIYVATQPAAPTATTTTTTTTTTSTPPAEKFKIAFGSDSPINDPWSRRCYEALLYARDSLGCEISYSESISEPDMERVIREYASSGYNLIIGHGFTFQAALFAAAPDYPDTFFAWNDGYETLPNLSVYVTYPHEAGYLAGMLAAGMSETGIIGAQGGMEVPNVICGIEGYRLGAQVINPDIELLVVYIGTFTDTGKGREAALAMIDAGADVIYHSSSLAGTGAIEAGEASGIYVIGDTDDQNSLGPETVITSVMVDHYVEILAMIEDAMAGNFGDEFYEFGLKDGASDIAPFHSLDSVVPQELKDQINQAREDILSGELVVPIIGYG